MADATKEEGLNGADADATEGEVGRGDDASGVQIELPTSKQDYSEPKK